MTTAAHAMITGRDSEIAAALRAPSCPDVVASIDMRGV
jgi:hypothetical protein